MSKQSSNQNMNVERQTEVQVQKPGCTAPLSGCIWFFVGIFLIGILSNEYKRSKIRLEMDTIRLEQMKKDTVVSQAKDETIVVTPDTLKIGNYQKTYVPLLKQYKSQQQKGR